MEVNISAASQAFRHSVVRASSNMSYDGGGHGGLQPQTSTSVSSPQNWTEISNILHYSFIDIVSAIILTPFNAFSKQLNSVLFEINGIGGSLLDEWIDIVKWNLIGYF